MSPDSSVAPPAPSPAHTHHTRAASFPGHDLLHSGMGVHRFFGMHVMAATFPVTAGLLFFGWRATGAIMLVVGSTAAAALIWHKISLRGARVRMGQVLWMSLLLSLMLPAHLLCTSDPINATRTASWPILPAAGATLVILIWVLGGAGAGRIHPVLITHLLMIVLFQDMLSPRYALKREHAFGGDVLQAAGIMQPSRATTSPARDIAPPIIQARPPWIASERESDPYDAVRSTPAAERLESFTTGHDTPERAWISLESLVRDRLPPLEDLIVGGQPAAIGQSSAIALIIGGLFLLYRGLIDFRVPLVIFTTAFLSFMILPVPVVITETARVWRWLAVLDPSVGPALGVTFADYELMASPLLFMGFFLATAPSVRPLTRRARAIYAAMVGVTSAAFQIYVSVAIGPYLALLGISLLSPTLDRLFKSRPIV